MKNEIKQKIHDHFGPMTTPTTESVLVPPKEQAATLMHDLEIMFPAISAMCEENQQMHIEALKEVMAERLDTYLMDLEDTNPALYGTLSNLMRL